MELPQEIEKKVQEASQGFNISLENVLQQGFNHFRQNPGHYILYSLAAFTNPISGILLAGPASSGFYSYTHKRQSTGKAGLRDFLTSLEYFGPLLALQLLFSLLVLPGLLLMLIPGIYFAVSLFFAQFFVLFYGRTPMEAARLSWKLVSGNFSQVLTLSLVILGINILGALALGVGLLLTIPLSACIAHAAFDDLIGIPK